MSIISKEMNMRAGIILRGVIIILFALLTVSCKDEEVDCNAVESQLEQVWRDLQEAALSGNCSQVSTLFKKSFSLLRKGKNCEYVTNLVADEGYATVEEFIDFLEEERDRVLDALDC